MGRVIKVRPGQPIPAQDRGMVFRMAKSMIPKKVKAAIECCEVAVDDLYWQGWDSHFDDTEWEPYGGAGGSIWDGEKWSSGNGGVIFIHPIGMWAQGYRPHKCRVTVITSGFTIIELLCEVNWWQGGIDVTSDGAWEFHLNVGGNDCDIYTIELWGPTVPSFFVTNIEFYPGEFNLKPDITEYIELV